MSVVLIRKGDWSTGTQREGHVRSQGEEGHLQAEERGLKGALTKILISDF